MLHHGRFCSLQLNTMQVNLLTTRAAYRKQRPNHFRQFWNVSLGVLLRHELSRVELMISYSNLMTAARHPTFALHGL